jgi:geranylgeranyl reductase family protein
MTDHPARLNRSETDGQPSVRAVVVGAGPAGSRVAFRLADAGWPVVLLDHRYPWEKPCGGGLNQRALALLRQTLPALPHVPAGRSLHLASAGGRRLQMDLDTTFAVLPRKRLQRLMVERAMEAGATLVTSMFSTARRAADSNSWTVETRDGSCINTENLIGADGALSAVRQTVAGPDAWRDVRPALGLVHVFPGPPPQSEGLHLVFTDDPPGYIWEFPGDEFSTVGISLPFDPRGAVKAREILHDHLLRRGWVGRPPLRGAMAPSASTAHWQRGVLQGDGWALLGDAAGLVDPLTGEGIYYALRSADLLAEALLDGRPERYTGMVRAELGPELALAARYVKSFFRGNFPDQMLALADKHEGIRTVLGNLVSGRQSYLGLKKVLFRSCVPAALRYLLLKVAGRW